MFTTLLIANRGEIACRIIRSCRRLGIRSIAVYSQADAQARHVRLADEAYGIGPAAARDSYLQIPAIIDVARRSGAQAIHPGYGFLSENEAFAGACEQAGIVFVGPPIAAIRAMGSKSAAKTLMQAAGVPLVPGYHGDDQAPDFLREQADAIGYPVLIKASAGGGGKGMRVVERGEDFAAALASCRREAGASFGDERVLIEKYLQRPRHIEVQVFGDRHGRVISLHERDCSAQRRHQKVVEEAPAPQLGDAQREAMSRAAIDAAAAVGYVGAGTVEFIADQHGDFYFMEMNTRLQVEHPVTEMITGLDLVEWQLRVAAGEALPLTQDQIPRRGHAIEVRLYAEDPANGFLPSIGQLLHWQLPAEAADLRIDSGVDEGDRVTPYYDPMLAKLIAWGPTREQAIERLLRALRSAQIVGVGHNLDFLARLVDHAEFRAGCVDTGLIERERDALIPAAGAAPLEAYVAALLWTLQRERAALRQQAAASLDPHSPWQQGDGWRLHGRLSQTRRLRCGEHERSLQLVYGDDEMLIDGLPAQLQFRNADSRHALMRWGERQLPLTLVEHPGGLQVFLRQQAWTLSPVDPLAMPAHDRDEHAGLSAPMPGKIIDLPAVVGREVDKGTVLLVMEAMKMEHTLVAPARGQVREWLCRVGDQVSEGAVLVDFQAAATH